MKNQINKFQKFKALSQILDKYPEAFAEKSKALEMKQTFEQRNDAISDLFSALLRPSSTIHRPKQDSQAKLTAAFTENLAMGILLATETHNAPLLDILKVYKSRIGQVSAFKLFEMASHVSEELENQGDLGADYGLTAEKLLAFKNMVADFGAKLDQTGALLKNRKSEWDELGKLLSANFKMVKQQIDPFVIFHEKDFPELYREYMLVRGSRKSSRRQAPKTNLVEILGTVTDASTGQPLAGAVVNLTSPESIVETDADGTYLIDELEPGDYSLNCYLSGYEVPAAVKVAAEAGESLVVDFALTPANEQQAA